MYVCWDACANNPRAEPGARVTNSEMPKTSAIMCWFGLVWTFDLFCIHLKIHMYSIYRHLEIIDKIILLNTLSRFLHNSLSFPQLCVYVSACPCPCDLARVFQYTCMIFLEHIRIFAVLRS